MVVAAPCLFNVYLKFSNSILSKWFLLIYFFSDIYADEVWLLSTLSEIWILPAQLDTRLARLTWRRPWMQRIQEKKGSHHHNHLKLDKPRAFRPWSSDQTLFVDQKSFTVWQPHLTKHSSWNIFRLCRAKFLLNFFKHVSQNILLIFAWQAFFSDSKFHMFDNQLISSITRYS